MVAIFNSSVVYILDPFAIIRVLIRINIYLSRNKRNALHKHKPDLKENELNCQNN